MSKLVVDSSAWVEYFLGTEKGRAIREKFKNQELLTTGLIASEVGMKFLRDVGGSEEVFTALKSLSLLIPFDFYLAEQTSEIYVKHRKSKPKFGLADAHVLAAARIIGAKVLTCDNDFVGIPDAIIIR